MFRSKVTAVGLRKRGASAIEVAILIGLIAIIGLVSISGLGVQVTSMFGRVGNDVALATAPPALTIVSASSASGVPNATFAFTPAASGGQAPYSWSLSSGTVPSGMTFSSATGAISGTPTSAGTTALILRVADAAGAAITQPFSLVIAAPMVITQTIDNVAEVGSYFNDVFIVSGGVAPYTWTMTGTDFPGITPTSMGINSRIYNRGTPSAAGTFNFTWQATDSTGSSVSKTDTITVYPSVATAGISCTTSGASVSADCLTQTLTHGVAYSFVPTPLGGGGVYRYQGIATFPPGITGPDSATGTISGTPTTAGNYSIGFYIYDGNPYAVGYYTINFKVN